MNDDTIINDPLCANALNNHFVHAADGTGKDDFITVDDDFNSIISCHKNTECIRPNVLNA